MVLSQLSSAVIQVLGCGCGTLAGDQGLTRHGQLTAHPQQAAWGLPCLDESQTHAAKTPRSRYKLSCTHTTSPAPSTATALPWQPEPAAPPRLHNLR